MAASHVEIIDIETLNVQSVLQTQRHLEAPNWARDGKSLIVNADGGLFKIDLAAPRLEPIDAGICTELNNDHGPSPDGQWMAISDKVETCASFIYVMPASC